MKGKIFDIKKFSLHDGEGLRTTVFLKGCPLSCVWCHNPEGISTKDHILYFEKRCIHCNTCINLCKNGGCKNIDNKIIVDNDANEDWDNILYMCPANALQKDSKEVTIEDVLNEILKDKPFYKYGGGVTFSGGEPFLQSKFLLELLKICKNEGIHTAIETSLFTNTINVKEAIQLLDMAYSDFKIFDNDKHKQYVGVDNTLIKENIKVLLTSKMKDQVIIRTPMIPGITTSKENIESIAAYISSIYSDVQYELLNYNPLAMAKYPLVNKEFCFKENPKKYSKEEMEIFASYARNAGVKNIIIES